MRVYSRNDAPPTEGTVKGRLIQIRWSNDSKIIGVFDMGPKIGKKAGLGPMMGAEIGQDYELHGQWKKNDKFNCWDFHFDSYRTVMPRDNGGIYHYLVNVGKWVGPETATRLLELFGPEVIDILKRDPQRVVSSNVRGLTPARIEELSESLIRSEKIETAMIEVANMVGDQLGMGIAKRAVDRWGSNAGHIIKRSPHRLVELSGVGFLKADAVFLKLGGEPEDLRRHCTAMVFVLESIAAQDGHTRVQRLEALAQCSQLLGQPITTKALQALSRTRTVSISADEKWISLTSILAAEVNLARRLLILSKRNFKPLIVPEFMQEEIESLEPEQMQAFEAARDESLLILTGAPGTGKTYTLSRIVKMWRSNGVSVAMAAPTGKAAKQMQLAINDGISNPVTIHSILQPATSTDGEFSFSRNESNPIPCTGIVIDEFSMVDVRLGWSLVRAIDDETRIIFVGDPYQLPSVGPGAVLRDIIESRQLRVVELTKIKRNAGLIVRACHSIKDGNVPTPAEVTDIPAGQNWRHCEFGNDTEIVEFIKALLSSGIKQRFNLDPTWQTQIISPTNEKGTMSCDQLNIHAKSVLNPGTNADDSLKFSPNDKVIQLRNGKVKTEERVSCESCAGLSQEEIADCVVCEGNGFIDVGGEIRIVNGDIGRIGEIEDKSFGVQFMYPTRRASFNKKSHNLKLAYAVTCHKMQGSEVPVVIVPLTRSIASMPMVNREWLYTAMSRARTLVITVGQLSAMPPIIQKIGRTKRTTHFVDAIQSYNRMYTANVIPEKGEYFNDDDI